MCMIEFNHLDEDNENDQQDQIPNARPRWEIQMAEATPRKRTMIMRFNPTPCPGTCQVGRDTYSPTKATSPFQPTKSVRVAGRKKNNCQLPDRNATWSLFIGRPVREDSVRPLES
ncbi:hypothetical protein ACLOJK_012771 [Asimina triloba]